MECRFPDKREEIKHNPETTDATETVCSWRTLVWRQAACGQSIYEGGSKRSVTWPIYLPRLTGNFKNWKSQSHSLKLASLDFFIHRCVLILHFWKHSRFSEAGMALISECTALARSWILVPNPLVVVCLFFFLLTYLFALFPRSERLEQARILKKRLPSTGWFNFWKESEIARAKSGEYSGCSINRMPLSSRYVCVLRAMWGAALSWCNWIRDRRRVRAVDWLCRRTFGNTEVV